MTTRCSATRLLELWQHRRGMRVRSSLRLSLRAAFCLTTPLVVGVATGHIREATLFSLGALWGVSQDGLDAWPVRNRRLLWLALAVLVGFGIGAVVGLRATEPAARIVLLAAAGLASGYLQASGLVSFGAYGLLGIIVGSGIVTAGSAWWIPVVTSLGTLWVWAVAAAMDRRSRHEVLRQCIAEAFDALYRAIGSIGRDDMLTRRSAARQALDVAQDAVGTRRPRRDIAEGIAIRQCMIIALHCGELVPYLANTTTRPPRIAEFTEIARLLRSGTAQRTIEELHGRQTGDWAAGRGAPVATALEIPSVERARSWAPRPIARFRPPAIECLRFGVLLGGSVAGATALALALRGPHAFWLPMSVAFILRPDLAPVIRRAAARTVGTLIGVAIAGVIALAGNPPVALIALSCAMAALMPGATRRGHGYAVVTFTPIVFVFIAMSGNDRGLFGARIVDTALAALLVFIVDLVAWTTSPSLRPAAQLARAEDALRDYLRCRPSTPLIERGAGAPRRLPGDRRCSSVPVDGRQGPDIPAPGCYRRPRTGGGSLAPARHPHLRVARSGQLTDGSGTRLSAAVEPGADHPLIGPDVLVSPVGKCQ